MTPRPAHPPLVIVGGGASAVFVTVALRERASAVGARAPHVTVVGTEAEVGRGLAYGRADPHHRLNSPAGKMSLSPTDEGGFLRWLDSRGWSDVDARAAAPGTFVPRRVFGDYVAEEFAALLADPDSGVKFVRGEVVGVEVDSSGSGSASASASALASGAPVRVVLADGTRLDAAAIVVAVGNPAPVVVDSFTAAASPSAALSASAEPGAPVAPVARVVADPWARGALDGVTASDRVLLVGTGLTAVDVATSLARRVPGVSITATSRHLLLPATHLDGPAKPGGPLDPGDGSLGAVMRAFGSRLREAAREDMPWQAVLDGVRPQFQSLWCGFGVDDRRRFLAHVARPWDVHRHRMAPSVRAELDGLLADGTLTLEARVDPAAFDVVVMCTGPRSVAERGWNPAVDSLLASGAAVADPTGLGFDTDADGALVSASGEPSDRLFAIGAALKGALWETVAIGEIRQLAARIADRVIAESVVLPEEIRADEPA